MNKNNIKPMHQLPKAAVENFNWVIFSFAVY